MPAPSNIQSFTSGPVMSRLADGTYIPALLPRRIISGDHQKMLIVIQYYEGDKQAAEDLAELIADLERLRNNVADVMIFRRHDASEFSASVLTKLRDKFPVVHYERSRRKDAKGYPFGSNQMWSELITMIGQSPSWHSKYYAFLPLEADCVPMRPGWINELIEEFRLARSKNFAAVGHIHRNPVEHLNGVAIYDSQFWKLVPGNRLNGSDPQVAYDLYHREQILPLAFNTPLIMMEYQRPTITAKDLFRPWKDGFEPAMFHGVKDASARVAVRAKHITHSAELDSSNRTVFTYEHQKPLNATVSAQYDLWHESWKSRGWNPVKLVLRDAVRSSDYAEVMKNLEGMQFFGDRTEGVASFVRWLALDSVGGGLLVDPEVIPHQFSPSNFDWEPALLSSKDLRGILAACFNSDTLALFIKAMKKYPVEPDDRLFAPELSVLKASSALTKHSPLVSIYGQDDWRSARMVCFNQQEMQMVGSRGSPIQLMEKFLRET